MTLKRGEAFLRRCQAETSSRPPGRHLNSFPTPARGKPGPFQKANRLASPARPEGQVGGLPLATPLLTPRLKTSSGRRPRQKRQPPAGREGISRKDPPGPSHGFGMGEQKTTPWRGPPSSRCSYDTRFSLVCQVRVPCRTIALARSHGSTGPGRTGKCTEKQGHGRTRKGMDCQIAQTI
jgi:hypothetical protein